LDDKNYSTPLLILEDDAEFSPNYNPILNIPDDSDGIYLGVSSGNVFYQTIRTTVIQSETTNRNVVVQNLQQQQDRHRHRHRPRHAILQGVS
jgi:hypothetical protein